MQNEILVGIVMGSDLDLETIKASNKNLREKVKEYKMQMAKEVEEKNKKLKEVQNEQCRCKSRVYLE